MIILLDKIEITCIDYSPGLMDGEVGLLLARSDVIRNEASENRNGSLIS